MLVGAAGSGKTTLRERLVAAGLPAEQVVSLDDERVALSAADAAAGRAPRPLQDHSPQAVRRAERAGAELLARGTGYLADATHLRRRERVAHVRAARAAGLPVVAVLMPALDADVLLARTATRPPHRRVPVDVLVRHAHRRSLLDAQRLLREDGFDAVVDVAAVLAGR